MKTDLQKFQEFLDGMNIKYCIDTGIDMSADKKRYVIGIDDVHLAAAWCPALNIVFDNDENFIEFEVWGE